MEIKEYIVVFYNTANNRGSERYSDLFVQALKTSRSVREHQHSLHFIISTSGNKPEMSLQRWGSRTASFPHQSVSREPLDPDFTDTITAPESTSSTLQLIITPHFKKLPSCCIHYTFKTGCPKIIRLKTLSSAFVFDHQTSRRLCRINGSNENLSLFSETEMKRDVRGWRTG